MLTRRSFLGGLLAAPAIVRPETIMPVSSGILDWLKSKWSPEEAVKSEIPLLYEELQALTRRAFVPKLIVEIYKQSPCFDYLCPPLPPMSLGSNSGCS